MSLNESIVEEAALEWFGELGYAVGHGPQMAPGEPATERDSFDHVVLVDAGTGSGGCCLVDLEMDGIEENEVSLNICCQLNGPQRACSRWRRVPCRPSPRHAGDRDRVCLGR
jgi:hypothetical protein